jgi:hypothetical protein
MRLLRELVATAARIGLPVSTNANVEGVTCGRGIVALHVQDDD